MRVLASLKLNPLLALCNLKLEFTELDYLKMQLVIGTIISSNAQAQEKYIIDII